MVGVVLDRSTSKSFAEFDVAIRRFAFVLDCHLVAGDFDYFLKIRVRGWTVCRFHGARGGAPKGERNGAYRHGLYTAKAADERRRLRDLLAQVRETMADIS